MSPFLLRTDSNFAVFFTDEVSPFHCQTGGLQKLTFHSAGKKVVIRTLLMARPVPCHLQEAGPRAPGLCPPTGPQERTKPGENTPSVPRPCLPCRVASSSCRPGAHNPGLIAPSTSVISQLNSIWPRPFSSQTPFPPCFAVALNSRPCT